MKNAAAPQPATWFLYLIECLDGSIYTGIALDVAARYAAHVSGKGARYTRTHPPARLLATMAYPDRSSALKAEYRIKQLRPAAKRLLVAQLSTHAPLIIRTAIRSNPGSVYNAQFISVLRTIMEAEQLNIIANRLVDLAQRATELRRYL